MKFFSGLIVVVSLMAAVGCTDVPPRGVAPATLSGDAAHPDATTGWVRTELYFGLGPVGQTGGVDNVAWQAFLDTQVTPRFPSGLTVVDAFGQWQGREQDHPEHLRSKIVVLLYKDSSMARASIDAIRTAWKTKTGDESVLRVTLPADVSF